MSLDTNEACDHVLSHQVSMMQTLASELQEARSRAALLQRELGPLKEIGRSKPPPKRQWHLNLLSGLQTLHGPMGRHNLQGRRARAYTLMDGAIQFR